MARNAKFWLLYKRPGQRVLINDRGDMLVRPLYAELSMQQSPFLTSLSQVLSSLNMARICIYSSHLPFSCTCSGSRGNLVLQQQDDLISNDDLISKARVDTIPQLEVRQVSLQRRQPGYQLKLFVSM